MEKMSDFPDFIIAGAAKSGTTSLSRYLNKHPDIYIPARELNFYPFCDRQNRIPSIDHLVIRDMETYKSYYKNVSAPVRGEKSVSYLYRGLCKITIDNIMKYHPLAGDLKLIFILRNPVDRAFSQYLNNYHLKESLPFEDATDAWTSREKKGWGPAFDYLGVGFYTEPLELYLRHFSSTRIFLYEDLRDYPDRVLSGLYTFLGVRERSFVDVASKHNVSSIPRNRLIHYIYRGLVTHNPLKIAAKRILSPEQFHALKRNFNAYTHYKPGLDMETRNRLTEFYKPEIQKLQSLIGRDLSHWMKT